MGIEISFKEATKVAAFATIVGVTAPASIPAAIFTTVIGVPASHLGVEIVDGLRVGITRNLHIAYWKRQARLAEQRVEELTKPRLPYQISLPLDHIFGCFDPERNAESVKRAFERLRVEHPSALQLYRDTYNRTRTDSESPIYSDDDLIRHFQNKMKEGTCNGQTRALCQTAAKTKRVFSPAMVKEMSSDEVFYGQMRSFIRAQFKAMQMGFSKAPVSEEDYEGVFDKGIEVSKSEKFDAFALPSKYQELFTKAAGAGSKTIMGYVHVPNHVFPFQCTPEGFFLYDSLDVTGGLYCFPSQQLFFEHLRKRAIHDLPSGSGQIYISIMKEQVR